MMADPMTLARTRFHTSGFLARRFHPCVLLESLGLGKSCEAVGLTPRPISCTSIGPCMLKRDVIRVLNTAEPTELVVV